MATIEESPNAQTSPRIRKSKFKTFSFPPETLKLSPTSSVSNLPHESLVFNEHGQASVHPAYQFVRQIYMSQASPGVVDLFRDCESGHEIIIKRTVKKRLFSNVQTNSAIRELELHRSISHRHIVKYYGSGENEEEYILAMEFISDYDYFTRRTEELNKPFCLKPDGGIEKLRSITFDILSALEYLHCQGIVHLDLKPSNLLFDRKHVGEGEYPLVKLCDFGLARKVNDAGVAFIEKRCGTDKYIAPEVRDHSNVTQAVDMWSFGMLVHQLSIGFLPYALKWSPGQVLPTVPRYWKKYQGSGLFDLVERCLKLNPDERITATEALLHPWFNRPATE